MEIKKNKKGMSRSALYSSNWDCGIWEKRCEFKET